MNIVCLILGHKWKIVNKHLRYCERCPESESLAYLVVDEYQKT